MKSRVTNCMAQDKIYSRYDSLMIWLLEHQVPLGELLCAVHVCLLSATYSHCWRLLISEDQNVQTLQLQPNMYIHEKNKLYKRTLKSQQQNNNTKNIQIVLKQNEALDQRDSYKGTNNFITNVKYKMVWCWTFWTNSHRRLLIEGSWQWYETTIPTFLWILNGPVVQNTKHRNANSS